MFKCYWWASAQFLPQGCAVRPKSGCDFFFPHQPCLSTITLWKRPGHRTGMSGLMHDNIANVLIMQAFWVRASRPPRAFHQPYLRPCGFLNDYFCFTTPTFRRHSPSVAKPISGKGKLYLLLFPVWPVNVEVTPSSLASVKAGVARKMGTTMYVY